MSTTPSTAGTSGTSSHDGRNTLDATLVKRFVRAIEDRHDEIASEKGAYMARAKTLRGLITNVYENAAANGIPRKELRAVIKTRELTRRLTGIRADLDGEQVETYDQIRSALGDLADLPLGAVVLDKAPGANA